MSDNITSEFLTMARNVPMTSSVPKKPTPPPPTAASKELRTFHQQAGGISRDIASTSALLSELTHAVRHKSLFEDDTATVNSLVVRIKGAIENLNARLETADRTIAVQKRALGKNSQAGQEAANLVTGLQTEFAEAAQDFKKVLQQRTETLKETESLQRQVYDNNNNNDMEDVPDMSSMSTPPVYGQGFQQLDLTSSLMAAGESTASSSLPRPHGIAGVTAGGSLTTPRPYQTNTNGSTNHGMVGSAYSSYGGGAMGNGPPLTPLDIQRMEQEQGDQLAMQLIPDTDYLQARADAMSTVETNIVELGTIFNKLAGLVHEHREMVQRVEDNVEDANASINLSMGVLTDTLENLRSNKALAFRLSAILISFIVFFVVFFA